MDMMPVSLRISLASLACELDKGKMEMDSRIQSRSYLFTCSWSASESVRWWSGSCSRGDELGLEDSTCLFNNICFWLLDDAELFLRYVQYVYYISAYKRTTPLWPRLKKYVGVVRDQARIQDSEWAEHNCIIQSRIPSSINDPSSTPKYKTTRLLIIIIIILILISPAFLPCQTSRSTSHTLSSLGFQLGS